MGRRCYLTRVNRSSDCIDYRIEIVCLIGTLSTILQHFTHTMKQWPTTACRWHFALLDVSCRQSCHLSKPSPPWIPQIWYMFCQTLIWCCLDFVDFMQKVQKQRRLLLLCLLLETFKIVDDLPWCGIFPPALQWGWKYFWGSFFAPTS